MLKVNEERLLHDREELVARREVNLAEIEADAREYAIARGYDEDKTERFVAFTKELEGNGLSAEEKTKLEILESYIEEVEEPVEEMEEDEAKTDMVETSTATGYASTYGI